MMNNFFFSNTHKFFLGGNIISYILLRLGSYRGTRILLWYRKMVSIGDCESLEVCEYSYNWGKTGSIPVPSPLFSLGFSLIVQSREICTIFFLLTTGIRVLKHFYCSFFRIITIFEKKL